MKTLRRARLLVHALTIASLVILGQGGAPKREAQAQGGSGSVTYAYDPLGRLIGLIDGTIVRAHQHAAGAKGGQWRQKRHQGGAAT